MFALAEPIRLVYPNPTRSEWSLVFIVFRQTGPVLLEFYETTKGLWLGDDLWRKIDIAQSRWRMGVQEYFASTYSKVIHISASIRGDMPEFAALWPTSVSVHYFEYTQTALEAVQSALGAEHGDKAKSGNEVGAGAKAASASLIHAGRANGRYLQSRFDYTRKMRILPNDAFSADDWLEVPIVETKSLAELCAETAAQVIILDQPGLTADILLSIPETGLPGNPPMLISSAERMWDQGAWRTAFDSLVALGYIVTEPSGATISSNDVIDHALSWFFIAIHRDTLEGSKGDMFKQMLRRIADRFRFEILGPGNLKVVEPATYEARCEVVSLKTAAVMTNSHYASIPCDDTVFDLYDRKMVSRLRPLEVAKFAQVDVFPTGSWKICIDKAFYVEEIGYSAKEKLHGIDSYIDWDGRRTVLSHHPLLTTTDTPPNAILLGGDTAYYHWILNWLPRLRVIELIEREFGHFETLHFVISNRIPTKFLDFVSLILKRPYTLTLIPERGVWRFNDLIVPSFCTSHELHPSIAPWYRTSLSIPARTEQKRYYLSRADSRIEATPRRKVINEEEVLVALKPFGFEPLLLGDADARQQVELFSQAAFVIGPHGAAFANMQFTPPGANAIVLENEWNHIFLADMLNQTGHNAEVVMCKDVINQTYEDAHTVEGVVDQEVRRSRDMIVDCDALVARVRTILAL